MSKPYTKEMWEEFRKKAAHEYLISTQKEDKKAGKEKIGQLILILCLSIFLFFFPTILFRTFHPGVIPSQKKDFKRLQETVDLLLEEGDITPNSIIYLEDLYNGTYSIISSPFYSYTKYPHQCFGYLTIKKNGKVDTTHYCDVTE